MTLQQTSLAAAVGASVKNTQFSAASDNLPHKIAVVGTYDPSKTVSDEVPQLILSPEDAGYRYGFGYMLHRLCEQVFSGSSGVETWVIPQSEISGADQATGTLVVTAVSTLSGTLALYIAGIPVPVTVTNAMTDAEIATAIVAAITADKKLPVTAEATDETVTFTSKTAGPWGNDITIKVNIQSTDVYPSGVSVEITDMSGGAGTPDIETALDALGTGDDANENHFTELVHGYGLVTAVLDDILTYVGQGNEYSGLYDKLVARPFRSLCGDTGVGSSRLTALIAISDNRKLDRANGVVAVPGSASHPAEIAAQTLGHMARINNDRVAQGYDGVALINIDPGDKADRWSSQFDSRDTAVKSGIGTTEVQNGAVVLQNVISFYRPDNVPVSSNGYRSMRNISIIQNMLHSTKLNFEQEKWRGISIVSNAARVSSTIDRAKVRDIDSMIDDLIQLVTVWESKGFIYDRDFTIKKLMEVGAVSIRSGTTGFNAALSVIFSGEGLITDTVIYFDTSIAVLL